MPKGRCCNPSTQRDGIWFRHPDPDELETITMQTTVSMLKQAELLKAQDPEWKAPLKFLAKPQKNTKPEFPFSSHDNRHAMQTSVEYFDAGLGRKKVEKDKGQHVSQNFVLWSHGTPPKATSYLDGYTNYQTSYTSLQGALRARRFFRSKHRFRHNALERVGGSASASNVLSDAPFIRRASAPQRVSLFWGLPFLRQNSSSFRGPGLFFSVPDLAFPASYLRLVFPLGFLLDHASWAGLFSLLRLGSALTLASPPFSQIWKGNPLFQIFPPVKTWEPLLTRRCLRLFQPL
ncbi:hypothetical protein NDU88_007523 [Pleurodeles waltl]|uniref:Domain of unknown function with conserved HDNR motif domain-containing protein n=1 Tax=Pleurodeles waltl TaxID=8319 RepID=A0AAV7QM49_PLEWA|nr:hypothetical protein NDU88_007523 [Pleurodeles waltl]